MGLFRQLMIFSLMPLVALSGMPDVACRCSNGEIRRHCPKLNQSRSIVSPTSVGFTSRSGSPKSCCGGTGATRSCCQAKKQVPSQSEHPSPACCAESCHCTRVLLEGNSGARLKTDGIPVPSRVDFLLIPLFVVRSPRLTRVDLDIIGISPHDPEDLIVRLERFLI